jgi:hypothetical protein
MGLTTRSEIEVGELTAGEPLRTECVVSWLNCWRRGGNHRKTRD